MCDPVNACSYILYVQGFPNKLVILIIWSNRLVKALVTFSTTLIIEAKPSNGSAQLNNIVY